MSKLPQLFMRKSSLNDLKEMTAAQGVLPENLSLHTHIAGQEDVWEALVKRSFGWKDFTFEGIMKGYCQYAPAHIFYLAKDGEDIATAAAFENGSYPGEGWLHMVCVDPSAQGMGLAKSVVLAALWSFYVRGYESVVLSTDDFRLPAIKTYLRLGFEPLMFHESHAARWEAVKKQL